jgi:hypothetical protein
MNAIHRLFVSVLVVVISAVVVPSWACDAMGPNRHVGVVTKIEPNAGTFTIIDAQTERNMTFTASKKILDVLALNREFIVTFRMEGQHMRAEAVVPAS